MRVAQAAAVVLVLATGSPLAWAEPPDVQHQPLGCTIPDKAISVCAAITDDGTVAKARVYFRPSGDKFYSFVDMAFGADQKHLRVLDCACGDGVGLEALWPEALILVAFSVGLIGLAVRRFHKTLD